MQQHIIPLGADVITFHQGIPNVKRMTCFFTLRKIVGQVLNQVEMRSFGPEFQSYKCSKHVAIPFSFYQTFDFVFAYCSSFFCVDRHLDYWIIIRTYVIINFVIEGEGSLAECGKEYRIGNLQARSDHYQNIFLFLIHFTIIFVLIK